MKKIKIALVSIYNNDMQPKMEEIGISLITAVLRRNGYEVLLFSAHEDSVDYDKIVNFNPDIIGFTVYLVSKPSVWKVSHKIKELLPASLVCVGGKYASLSSKQLLLENQALDFVVRGEGEETFLELVEKINNGEGYSTVKGISYRFSGEIIENTDRAAIHNLDTIPFAARDILRDTQMQAALISTSRGCRARCSFCSTQLYLNKWRGRSINNIVDELEYLQKQFHINLFQFIDSSIEDSDNDLERLCGMAREIIGRGLKLYYYGNVRSEFHRKVTPGNMELLKRSGLTAVCIGGEAGNSEDLRLYKKIANTDDNEKMVELAGKYGIVINLGFINFNPYTTLERLEKNIDFLSRSGFAKKFISRLWVFKDTGIYNKLLADNLLNKAGKIGWNYGEIQYVYKDREIAEFSDFLFNYAEDIDTHHNKAFLNYDYYSFIFLVELIYYRGFFQEKQDRPGLEKINGFLDEHKRISGDFNNAFTGWIKSLLNIFAHGWDQDKISACTRELMPVNKFTAINEAFGHLARKTRLFLARSGHADLLLKLAPF